MKRKFEVLTHGLERMIFVMSHGGYHGTVMASSRVMAVLRSLPAPGRGPPWRVRSRPCHAPGVSTGAGLAVSLLRSARCGLELGWAPDGVNDVKLLRWGKGGR